MAVPASWTSIHPTSLFPPHDPHHPSMHSFSFSNIKKIKAVAEMNLKEDEATFQSNTDQHPPNFATFSLTISYGVCYRQVSKYHSPRSCFADLFDLHFKTRLLVDGRRPDEIPGVPQQLPGEDLRSSASFS